MKKILFFVVRGHTYAVDQQGRIKGPGLESYSSEWLLLGVSRHHWSRRVEIPLSALFENPERMKNGLVWDRDHGTVRQWGGQHGGKLPRVTAAWIEES